ncbi:hypothetical protein NE686_17445 [Tissierella carlieri]|uniref:Uncharacterized protein n=1 Tax=Tissierella carlieri TaxID=689904 RepID=A0ABT1SEI2_9FIRM|nr:hypothetical protein [Tissierella carlieri]MCQ4924890.1 hypothetical protein [Tissierella carlieri]
MLMSIVALISFILYMVLFAIETDIILDEKSYLKESLLQKN